MMITPHFELTQDANFIFVSIKAPHAQISDAEIYIEECDFKFYAKPYYLRLNLPGAVLEDGRETAKYDCDKGLFKIRMAKAQQGEFFDGLDLITKLLAPCNQLNAASPKIEVLTEIAGDENSSGGQNEEELEFDWQIEQVPYSEPELSIEGSKYGFANQRSGVFERLQSEFHDLIDLQDADSTAWQERKCLRESAENTKFDKEYYMADYCDDSIIQTLLKFQPEWHEEVQLIDSNTDPEVIVNFTEAEREKMMKLPRKEYILDEPSQQIALMTLVDIIYAYTYNHITTEGENTVESGWTICKLSSTLSWLDIPNSLKEVVRSSYRRSMCYPLYRHWKLACKVFSETCNIFISGRRRILKCLLEIHTILSENEPRYILNDLYITDYCVWIQSIRKKHLDSLSKHLNQVNIKKSEVGFDLSSLEEISLQQQEDESSHLVEGFTSLHLSTDSPVYIQDQPSFNETSLKIETGERIELASSTDSETDTSSESEESDDESECESQVIDSSVPPIVQKKPEKSTCHINNCKDTDQESLNF